MRFERTFRLGGHDVRIETGELAHRAAGAVLLDMQGTVVLATVVAARHPEPGQSFFPLTVDCVESPCATARIPPSRDHREGWASEGELLLSRLIDRSIRPLFPSGFRNEVHVLVHVMSVNPAFPPDVPALLATAAALRVSALPFDGPLAAVCMGHVDGLLLCNPTMDERRRSELDMLVAANRGGVVMVAPPLANLPHAVASLALQSAQEAMQPAFDAMDALRSALANDARGLPAHAPDVLSVAIEDVGASSVLVGEVYDATVAELVDFFGVVLEIKPGQWGLLHASRMAHLAGAAQAQLRVGQTVRVRVVGRNREGKFETTMLCDEPSWQGMPAPHPSVQAA